MFIRNVVIGDSIKEKMSFKTNNLFWPPISKIIRVISHVHGYHIFHCDIYFIVFSRSCYLGG